jgi:hypothetical protein
MRKQFGDIGSSAILPPDCPDRPDAACCRHSFADIAVFRIIRIAILLLSCVACVALVAMWVRSFETAEQWPRRTSDRMYLVASKQGRVAFLTFEPHGVPVWWERQHRSLPVVDELSFPRGDLRRDGTNLGFSWVQNPIYSVMRSTQTLPDGRQIMIMGAATAGLRGGGPIMPYWFLVLAVAAFGGLATLKWPPRFRLRGMFVAMTVVAVVLGLEICLGR